MIDATNEMLDFMSKYISKGDVLAAKAIAKVSAFIYKKRKSLKMNQKEFAEMMGVTQSMVSKWESANYNFTIESIADIAGKLDVNFDIQLTPENEYQKLSNEDSSYDEIPSKEKSKNNRKGIVDLANFMAA